MFEENRYFRKRKHKRLQKKRFIGCRYSSWRDYLAHESDREGDYWKSDGLDRWWNRSDGSRSAKPALHKLANRSERAFWRQLLHTSSLQEEAFEDLPTYRKGHKHADLSCMLW